MPQYSFLCTADTCATQFDTIQGMNAPFPACPDCGAGTKRVITSVPAVSLKGGNWSQDGYRGTDQGAQAIADKADRKGRIVSFPGQKNKGREGL